MKKDTLLDVLIVSTEITGLEPVTYALTVRRSTIELYLIIADFAVNLRKPDKERMDITIPNYSR